MELFSWHWASWEDSTRPSYPRLVVINDSQNGQNILRVPVLGPTYGLASFCLLGTPALPCFCVVFGVAGLCQECCIQCVLVHNSGFICRNMIFLLSQKRLSKIFHFCFFSKCWWAPSKVLWTQNSVFHKTKKYFVKQFREDELFIFCKIFIFF